MVPNVSWLCLSTNYPWIANLLKLFRFFLLLLSSHLRVVRGSSLRDLRWEIIQFWGHMCVYRCARFLQWNWWYLPDNGRECSLRHPRLFLHQICEIPYLRYDYQFSSWDQYYLYCQHPRTNWVSLSQLYYQGTWILYNHRHSRYVFQFFDPWWCRYAKIINSFIIFSIYNKTNIKTSFAQTP